LRHKAEGRGIAFADGWLPFSPFIIWRLLLLVAKCLPMTFLALLHDWKITKYETTESPFCL
jgi:hypothetical protein